MGPSRFYLPYALICAEFLIPGCNFQLNLVADQPEGGQFLFIRSFDGSRIIKWPMQPLSHARKDRTAFLCPAAHRDEVPEMYFPQEFIQSFRAGI